MAQIVEPWLEDEAAFFRHFDISHEDFCHLIRALKREQVRNYEAIRKVNVEAAILWAIHEGKRHGLLRVVPDEAIPVAIERANAIEEDDESADASCIRE